MHSVSALIQLWWLGQSDWANHLSRLCWKRKVNLNVPRVQVLPARSVWHRAPYETYWGQTQHVRSVGSIGSPFFPPLMRCIPAHHISASHMAASAQPHTLPIRWSRQLANIRTSSGRGVLIPISSLLFHTVGDGACYSEHGESLRSTALWLPPCNQPLWLFRTHQALIATFIWSYSHSVRCCRGTFLKNDRGHPWNKVENGLTCVWMLSYCCERTWP